MKRRPARCDSIMPRGAVRSPVRAAMLFALLPLAACAQTVETRVNSAGLAGALAARYIAALPDKVSSPEYETARGLIAAKLSARGYIAAADGTLFLQIGIAQRPASLALKQAGRVLSPASGARASTRCVLREYRLTLALTKIADGTEIYRASASEFHCKLDIERVLPALVDAALADLGAPRGGYVGKRTLPSS